MRQGTSLIGDRLIKMILLMTLADSSAVFQGTKLQKMQVQKYISRPKEPRKRYHRRSTWRRWRKMERNGLIILSNILNQCKS
jgi:3-methyladenine DNA glycosylase/8-oxoguanine DNA glycosylase